MGQLLSDDVLLVSNLQGQILTLWNLSTIPLTYSYDGPSVCTEPKWESEPLMQLTTFYHPSWPPPRITDNVAFQVIPQIMGMRLLTVPLPLSDEAPQVAICTGRSTKGVHPEGFFSSSRGEVAYVPFHPYSSPPSFLICYNLPLGTPAAFTIPFETCRPFFDAFSCRLVLDDLITVAIHIGIMS